MLYVLTGATCAGKNTVYEEIKKVLPINRVITTTTRKMRSYEKEGVDYFFITRDEFLKKLENEEFAEFNEYAGNLYGTRWEQAAKAADDKDKLYFIILDVNGALAVEAMFEGVVSIFITPPTFETLRERIIMRGENTPEEIKERLAIAREEMRLSEKFDYCVVNETVCDAVEKIVEIVNGRI